MNNVTSSRSTPLTTRTTFDQNSEKTGLNPYHLHRQSVEPRDKCVWYCLYEFDDYTIPQSSKLTAFSDQCHSADMVATSFNDLIQDSVNKFAPCIMRETSKLKSNKYKYVVEIADAKDRKSTRLNSSHPSRSRMPSSA